jgi:hypothetical protein
MMPWLAWISLSPLTLRAQTAPVSSIRIYTEPSGANFMVDGALYNGSQTFLWPQGSKHIVQFPFSVRPDGTTATFQETIDGTTRYNFAGWTDNRGLISSNAPNQTITADPAITSLKASVSIQYRIAIRISNVPVPTPACAAPGDPTQNAVSGGIVYIGGQCYASDADVWMNAGEIPISAFPYPGWVFTGWNIGGQPLSSYLRQCESSDR